MYIPFFNRKNNIVLFSESVLPQAMREITKVFKEENIDFCFIGGVVVYNYGYHRTTDDIDILISRIDKDKFLSLRGKYFKNAFEVAQKSFYWNNPKAKFEILYSGEKAGDRERGIEYLEPYKIKILKNGYPLLDLKYLISYKLSAGIYARRLKDFSDVQELIKINQLKKNFANYLGKI